MCIWVKSRFLTVCALLITNALFGADSRTAEVMRLREPRWPSPPVQVSLKRYGGGCVPLEFSPDGQLLCAWWLPHPPIGDYNKLPGLASVFDIHGSSVPEATDAKGQLAGRFASMFSDIAWRWRFSYFVQDTNGWKVTAWGVSADYTVGVRFVQPEHKDFAGGKVELWHLGQTNWLSWSTALPESVNGWTRGTVWFFDVSGSPFVLVAFNRITGYVLSQEDGKVIESFTYGKPDSPADAEARAKRFHLDPEDYGANSFSAGILAFEPSRKLLACGDSSSKRLRIVAVDKPHRVLFEANSEDNPAGPRGGTWSVASGHFDGNGRYLVVGYSFGGRLASKQFEPIEIYDTGKWRLVWSVNNPGICSAQPPRVSPDGKVMALIRGDVLQIGPFVAGSDAASHSPSHSGK